MRDIMRTPKRADESVAILLTQPKINDTIRDEQGRTALECAATSEVAAVIEGALSPFSSE